MSLAPIVQHLVDDLNAVLLKYSDIDITNVEALGALEMVKLDLFEKIRRDADSPGSDPDDE